MFFLEVSTASHLPAIIGRTILKFQPSPIYSSSVQNTTLCQQIRFLTRLKRYRSKQSLRHTTHKCTRLYSEMTKR